MCNPYSVPTNRLPPSLHWNALDCPAFETLQLDRTRLRGEEPPRQTLVAAVSKAEPTCKARRYSHLTTTAVAEDANHPGRLTRKVVAGRRLLHLRVSANALVLGRWNWPRHERLVLVLVPWTWPVRHRPHAYYFVLPPGAGRLGCRLRGWVYRARTARSGLRH